MEYCSYVTNNYIICECGENFASEDLLTEHLENGHSEILEPDEPETTTAESSSDAVYYIVDNRIVPSSFIVEYQNVTQDEDPDTGQIQVTFKEEVDEEGQSQPATVVEYPMPSHVGFESAEHCARILDIKTEQESYESTIKPVVFTKQSLLKQQVLLGRENEEHCYEKPRPQRHLPKQYYFCEVCGKSFHTQNGVSVHLKKMHWLEFVELKKKRAARGRVLKKAVCDICGKKYTSNAALRYHMRVHTGERPYACTVCPRAFTMPLFLQIHLRTHTGERPYACEQCPKAFPSKAALLRHRRVHTGEKPYECPQCKKCFSQSNSMKLHVQTVHLKLPAPYKSKARKLKALMRQQEILRYATSDQDLTSYSPQSEVNEESGDEQLEEQVGYEEEADPLEYKHVLSTHTD